MEEKKKKTTLAMQPTPWLINLPAGSYSMIELERLTGRRPSTIKQRLSLLGIPKTYDSTSGYPLVIFNWVGIEEYNKQHEIVKDVC